MKLSLQQVGRRFNHEWIFKEISLEATPNQTICFLGSNGSGKSTLLQICAGILSPSEGRVSLTVNHKTVPRENIYHHVAIAAPYLHLYDDMTLEEAFRFHSRFKQFQNNMSLEKLKEEVGLQTRNDKLLRSFSSGMRQRVKLGFAMLSDSSLLLLDEPGSNLDAHGIEIYRHLLAQQSSRGKIIIIASNSDEREMPDEAQFINISNHVPKRD